jgi:hypothetical protein
METRLPWLFQDLGFRVTNHAYSYKHMGDSIAELQSDALRIRFIRDRSTIQVEVASLSDPERWMELGFLYANTGYRPEPQVEGWAWFFRDHLSELTDALGTAFAQTRKQFERKQQESLEILARHTPSVTLIVRLRRFRATPSGMILMGPFGWIIAAGLIAFLLLTR